MQRSTTVVIIIATVLFGVTAALVGYLRDRSAGEPFDAQQYLEKSIATAAGQAPGSSLMHASTEGLDDSGRVHGEVRGFLLARFGSPAPAPSNEPPPMLGAPHASALATCVGGEVYTHVRSGTRGGRTLLHEWEPPSRPNCGPTVGRPPRCTFRQIWQKAIAKGARLAAQYGLTPYDAAQLAASRALADFFEASAALFGKNPKTTANECIQWRESILSGRLSAETIAHVVEDRETGLISATAGKTLVEQSIATGKAVRALREELGLTQMSDTGALEAVVAKVIEANPNEVGIYKGGKEGLLSFFVGQVMKETKGKANPTGTFTHRPPLSKSLEYPWSSSGRYP